MLALSSCAERAGQLRAASLDPLVAIVAADLEEYIDADIAPDGTPLTPARERELRGSIVVLRNVLHTAMGRDREPLPLVGVGDQEE